MPELGEVAHAASLLRRFLLGQTIKKIEANVDALLFVKPLENTSFIKHLEGTKVTNVGRHGKYFWFEVNNAKTVLLHFGMTGWIHVRNVYTHFIAMENAGDKKQKDLIAAMGSKPTGPVITEGVESKVWPPKFTKFTMWLENGTEVCFSDPRRLGRCRVFDTVDILGLEPLSKLGRDYSQDPLEYDAFKPLVLKRKVPVKAFLLDQAVFSGIGNWMGDEVLYQARIHPEQYCNTLDMDQVRQLYDQVLNVCTVSVHTEGNTAAFPDNWLMLHRWGKRRKNEPQVTPWGEVYEFLTVGGRTSCFVPAVQKKPLQVLKQEIKEESDGPIEEENHQEPPKKKKRPAKTKDRNRRTSD